MYPLYGLGVAEATLFLPASAWPEESCILRAFILAVRFPWKNKRFESFSTWSFDQFDNNCLCLLSLFVQEKVIYSIGWPGIDGRRETKRRRRREEDDSSSLFICPCSCCYLLPDPIISHPVGCFLLVPGTRYYIILIPGIYLGYLLPNSVL